MTEEQGRYERYLEAVRDYADSKGIDPDILYVSTYNGRYIIMDDYGEQHYPYNEALIIGRWVAYNKAGSFDPATAEFMSDLS